MIESCITTNCVRLKYETSEIKLYTTITVIIVISDKLWSKIALNVWIQFKIKLYTAVSSIYQTSHNRVTIYLNRLYLKLKIAVGLGIKSGGGGGGGIIAFNNSIVLVWIILQLALFVGTAMGLTWINNRNLC